MKSLPNDLHEAKKLLYDPCCFLITEPQPGSESSGYGACSFLLNGLKVKFRVARTTPTKPGLFTSTWKRNNAGMTAPFDQDDMDYMVISVRENQEFGQFVFPKSLLAEQGIVSVKGKSGKRGTRVYPPWSRDLSRQAQKTQQWQCLFFIHLSSPATANTASIEKARKYFGLN